MKYGRYTMGLVHGDVYKNKTHFNCGDYIQQIAMDNIYAELGYIDGDLRWIDNVYDARKCTTNIVMPSSIFMMREDFSKLPFPKQILPMFTSVVLQYDFLDSSTTTLEYFRNYMPIGCRDEYTRNIFRGYGIDSYLMGCYTLCFPRRNENCNNGKIFFVDAPAEIEEKVPAYIRNRIVKMTHDIQINFEKVNCKPIFEDI